MLVTTKFLHRGDYHLYESWLNQQDQETLKLYFGTTASKDYISSLMQLILDNVEKHNFLIAYDCNGWLGVVHIASINDNSVEFGFIVGNQYRNQGIADRLMDEAVTWVRNRGYQRLFLHCLSWNQPIKKLCQKYGLELQTRCGDSDVDVKLPPPSFMTVGKEIGFRNLNVWSAMLNRTLNLQ